MSEKVEVEECGICDENGFSKILFGCGHSVCEECVKNLRSFGCPYCRYNIKPDLSEELIKSIEKNQNDKKDEERREYLKHTLYSIRDFILDFKRTYFVNEWSFPDEIIINSQDIETVQYAGGDVVNFLKTLIFKQIEKFALDPEYKTKNTSGTILKYIENDQVLESITII